MQPLPSSIVGYLAGLHQFVPLLQQLVPFLLLVPNSVHSGLESRFFTVQVRPERFTIHCCHREFVEVNQQIQCATCPNSKVADLCSAKGCNIAVEMWFKDTMADNYWSGAGETQDVILSGHFGGLYKVPKTSGHPWITAKIYHQTFPERTTGRRRKLKRLFPNEAHPIDKKLIKTMDFQYRSEDGRKSVTRVEPKYWQNNTEAIYFDLTITFSSIGVPVVIERNPWARLVLPEPPDLEELTGFDPGEKAAGTDQMVLSVQGANNSTGNYTTITDFVNGNNSTDFEGNETDIDYFGGSGGKGNVTKSNDEIFLEDIRLEITASLAPEVYAEGRTMPKDIGFQHSNSSDLDAPGQNEVVKRKVGERLFDVT